MTEEANQSAQPQLDDFELLRRIIECLRPLDADGKVRLLKSAITYLRLDAEFGAGRADVLQVTTSSQTSPNPTPSFSERTEMSPKHFLLEKQPSNDIERVVCLAYYLAHFRGMPEFKTLDLSKLNTEAAQPKFSNPSVPVDHATRRGFLVATSGWNKQLGALGEQFVQALPDRDLAKTVLDRIRRRKPRRKRGEPDSADAKTT